jgi:hypothetical protein
MRFKAREWQFGRRFFGGALMGAPNAAVVLTLVVAMAAAPAMADLPPQRVQTADQFRDLVTDRALTRWGVRLQVGADGQITGRVMGREVKGQWEWRDGFFCRDFFGKGLLGYDCQTVELLADQMRFRAERGTGDTLDLRLR